MAFCVSYYPYLNTVFSRIFGKNQEINRTVLTCVFSKLLSYYSKKALDLQGIQSRNTDI